MTNHLDSEALSAAMDGEATLDEQGHLARCPQCQDALSQLAAVARAIGSPVAPRAEREVAAAVSLALGSAAQPAPSDAAGSQVGANGSAARGRRGRSTLSPRWVAVAGVAAAIAVAGGFVGLSRLGDSGSSRTASVSAARPPQQPLSETAAGAAPAGPADLGNQSDPATVAQIVRDRLNSSGSAAGNAPRATQSPAASAPGRGPVTAGGAAQDGSSAPCGAFGPAAAGVSQPQPPLLAAPLRWGGEPAEVLVYARPGGLAGVVMRVGDCARLAVLPL